MITEWWQQLIFSLVTIAFGALIGYLFTHIGAKQERKSRNEEELKGAISGILVELETNLELAKKPFSNNLVPFVNSNWEIYKGKIIRLPEGIRNILYGVYVEIELANSLVEADINQLDYGRGYYNEQYKEKKGKI
jgi:hypothetical protein